jgi:hypothetical protein
MECCFGGRCHLHAEMIRPLWETVDTLLSHNLQDKGKHVFVLAFARRNVSMDLVWTEATAFGFEWTTVSPTTTTTTTDPSEGVFIVTRKKVK